jgi:HNH endonuclease
VIARRKEFSSKTFWDYVKKTKTCWLWMGPKDKDGYGKFREHHYVRRVLAHRYSWQLHWCPIGDDICVLHHCDVRNCVRPDHLFLGEPPDNSHDMVVKNRSAYGVRNFNSKINDRLAREIRRKYVYGSTTAGTVALGKQYGLHYSTVWDIVNHNNWQRVSD